MHPLLRRALVTGLVLAAALAPLACGEEDRPGDRGAGGEDAAAESVVLVTIDTLRADHLGAYGYPRAASPFVDRFAESGIVFERALSASSHTAPSHASLLTGRYPQQHQLLLNGEPMPAEVPTLAEHLLEQGFLTAAFPSVGFLGGLRRGFETFDSPRHYRPATETLAAAAEWLQAHAGTGRLFVWIHLFDVHEWYKPENRHLEAIEEVKRTSPLSRDELLEFLAEHHATPLAPFQTAAQALERIDAYDGQLLATDRALAAFWKQAAALGLRDEAAWIVTSDHGEGLGNHHFLGHGKHVYNEQLLVPLILRLPDLTDAGLRVVEQVRLVDLPRTIVELLGTGPFEGPLAGRSLIPLLAGGTEEDRRPAFSERPPATERALRNGWREGEVITLQDERFKLILHSWGEPELYDLASDPHELQNLAADGDPLEPRLAEAFSRLQSRLRRGYQAMKETGATLERGEIADRYREELRALGYL